MKANKVKKYNVGGYVQAAMGVAQMATGWYQAQRANAAIKRILADAPKIETPSAYYQLTKDAYDQELMQQQLADINRDLGTSTQALSQAGGRALVGGLGQSVDYSQKQKGAVYGAEAQQRLAAQQMLAQREDVTQQQREQRLMTQLESARQAKQIAQQNMMGGVGAIAEGAMFAGIPSDSSSTEDSNKSLMDWFKEKRMSKSGASEGAFQGIGSGIGEIAGSGAKLSGIAGDFAKRKKALGQVEDLWMTGVFETGGKMKVKKTGGKFDHKSNPIDIVQKGDKIGEMTGGEYIFNPSQVLKIKELIKAKNSKGLEKYMQGLVSKFENI
jgi:hypothetical protein